MKVPTIAVAVAMLALSQPAGAQAIGEAAARDPADPRADVPALPYRSPFVGYRPFVSGPVGPWRDMNDEVARIGGWKAYAREAYEASKQVAPAADGAGKAPAAQQESAGPRAK